MTWNPRLLPYKNAITNELWIAASIAMHEHYPATADDYHDRTRASGGEGPPRSDPVFILAATEGYRWFQDVNMTNLQGLNVDGYHIDGSKPENTECDLRDEMVYTYNQGVILTGQRGLFAATGNALYLFEGHALIQDVIGATGLDLGRRRPSDETAAPRRRRLPPWRGPGRRGILEEQCDVSGTCSQDAQTFKAIFFHHLTAFCAPLGSTGAAGGPHHDGQRLGVAHAKACRAYSGWVKHNVDAALATRDPMGRFGMWWGAGFLGGKAVAAEEDGIDHGAANTTDYRNKGTPRDEVWGVSDGWEPGSHAVSARGEAYPRPPGEHRDPNSRGRGRTVETQIGGIALLRAYYELSRTQ